MEVEEIKALVTPFQHPMDWRANKSRRCTSVASIPCRTPLFVAYLFMITCLFVGATEVTSYEYGAVHEDWRITCYTCMNVSNNEECNRYAIDRPCPEGKEFCLTLHVMEGLDSDRSVLVNKRCAPLEDCVGDSTGCITAYGQTQCVSCCDQPYCNDYVPVNDTNATFQRSRANGIFVYGAGIETIWRTEAVIISAFTTVLTFVRSSGVL